MTSRVAALVVDLTGVRHVHLPAAAFADALGSLVTVTIGLLPDPHDIEVEPYAAPFDVVLPPARHDELEELLDSVVRSPLAATTLALLLRGADDRTVTDGLIAESMAYSLLQAGPEFADWRRSRPIRNRPPEIGPAVRSERDGDVVHVTLARPHVHNAFSVRLRDGLVDALAPAALDPTVTGVVIDGAGPSFCSGGDLDEFGSFPDAAESHVIRLTRHAGRAIDAIATKTEVRIHGATMGSGIELAAFAGRVVAHPDTLIGLPEIALGLVPGAGGTVSLPRRIGRQRTAYLALSGARLTAATALEWGLVDEISE